MIGKLLKIMYGLLVGTALGIVITIAVGWYLYGTWGKTDPFFITIENKLNTTPEGFLLSDLTDFEWNRVCFITKVDSAPRYSVFNAYKEELEKINAEPAKKSDYKRVLVFFEDNQLVKQYSDTKYANFRVNGEFVGWTYENEHVRKTCTTDAVRLVPHMLRNKFPYVNLTTTKN